jgi:hypothetical protein
VSGQKNCKLKDLQTCWDENVVAEARMKKGSEQVAWLAALFQAGLTVD